MQIHGSQVNISAFNAFAAAAENALAKQQRADEVRKRLAKSVAALEAAADPDQVFLVGQWTGAHDNPSLTGDEYRAAASGKDSDFG
jgi:predicted NBD/HSP70 family sugar kinase